VNFKGLYFGTYIPTQLLSFAGDNKKKGEDKNGKCVREMRDKI
jgi:hypothetical protein